MPKSTWIFGRLVRGKDVAIYLGIKITASKAVARIKIAPKILVKISITSSTNPPHGQLEAM